MHLYNEEAEVIASKSHARSLSLALWHLSWFQLAKKTQQKRRADYINAVEQVSMPKWDGLESCRSTVQKQAMVILLASTRFMMSALLAPQIVTRICKLWQLLLFMASWHPCSHIRQGCYQQTVLACSRQRALHTSSIFAALMQRSIAETYQVGRQSTLRQTVSACLRLLKQVFLSRRFL